MEGPSRWEAQPHSEAAVGSALLQAKAELQRLKSELSKSATGLKAWGNIQGALNQLQEKLANQADAHIGADNQPQRACPVFSESEVAPGYSEVDDRESISTASIPTLPKATRNTGLLSAKEKVDMHRAQSLLAQPERFGKAARSLLEKRYGVPAPKNPGLRRSQGAHTFHGKKRAKGKVSTVHNVLPRENRVDPAAPLPPIDVNDVQRGLYSLMERGFLPSYVDLTPAVGLHPPPLQTGAATLHVERGAGGMNANDPSKRRVATSTDPVTRSVGVSSLKMDLRPTNSKPSLEVSRHHVNVPEARVESHETKTQEDARARQYNQLNDQFSLHHFLIRRGRILHETPEFESFQRTYSNQWGVLFSLCLRLQSILLEHTVPIAIVDGHRLAEIAAANGTNVSDNELLTCIVNQDRVYPHVLQSRNRFGGARGEHLAATAIQAVWRGYVSRSNLVELRERAEASTRIQQAWRAICAIRHTRMFVKRMAADALTEWKESVQAPFVEKWKQLYGQKRVVVHIPSMSCSEYQRRSMNRLHEEEAAQILRLCDVMDPNVEVILVSPFPVNSEAESYYAKLLAAALGSPDAVRFRVLYPEMTKHLPPHTSLAMALLCSDRCMARLKTLVKGRVAYVVPGPVQSEADLRLCVKLRLPLLGTLPSVGVPYSTKSGGARIFTAADISMLPSATDIVSADDLISKLAHLMLDYPEVESWVLKIDNEIARRGFVTLQTNLIPTDQRQDIDHLRLWLAQNISEIGRFRPDVYHSFNTVCEALESYGGMVEAFVESDCQGVSSNLFLSPDGSVYFVSSLERWTDLGHDTLSFPQQAFPETDLKVASMAAGRVLAGKGVVGYVTLDFLCVDGSRSKRLFGIDVNIGLSTRALVYHWFQFLSSVCSEEPRSTKSIAQRKRSSGSNDRAFIYSGVLVHPGFTLLQYGGFFQMCKSRGISFDLQHCEGTCFHIIDSFLRGICSFFVVGQSLEEALHNYSKAIAFLDSELNREAERSFFTVESNFSAVHSVLGNMLSAYPDVKDGRRVRA